MPLRDRGFTLIELLLALLLVALLSSLVAPIVTQGISRARESTLKEDLYQLRKAIDDYHADTGKYPAELAELVDKRYLRRVPVDPITEKRETWVLIRDEGNRSGSGDGGIIDICSGSDQVAVDGSAFKDW
jgi:general secretion pathway protein G